MLRLLQSIFGFSDKQQRYPEALIKETIERVVEKTDPWLKVVSGYKNKLRPAVIRSLDHVVRLVSSLPPPIPVEFGPNGSCPSLSAFFVSTTEMLEAIRNDRNLTTFLRDHEPGSTQVTALLMMEKSEKTIFGAELSGDVVVRDVPQVTVTFSSHRFLEPSMDENETRFNLERRAIDHLLNLVLRRIATAKTVRKDLERRRSILHSKLTSLQKGEGSSLNPDSINLSSVAEIKGKLKQIEADLQVMGREDHMLDAYLDMAITILSHPEKHLWGEKHSIILDQTGIKRTRATENDREISLHEFYNSEGRQWVMFLIALPGDELRNICS
ncbi:MAG: hypothetical protein PHD01_13190 [Geobacteraceae bacterium]|nr:hypothetical protein [Geobacteraceae bacterium]